MVLRGEALLLVWQNYIQMMLKNDKYFFMHRYRKTVLLILFRWQRWQKDKVKRANVCILRVTLIYANVRDTLARPLRAAEPLTRRRDQAWIIRRLYIGRRSNQGISAKTGPAQCIEDVNSQTGQPARLRR